jgi:hypothetical protein
VVNRRPSRVVARPILRWGEQRVKGRYERAAQPASDGLLSGEGKGRFPSFGILPSVPGSIRCRIVRRVSLASVTGPSGRILWGNVTPSNLEPRRCRRLHRASPHQRFRRVQRVPIGRSSDRGQERGRRGPSGRFWARRSESRSGSEGCLVASGARRPVGGHETRSRRATVPSLGFVSFRRNQLR